MSQRWRLIAAKFGRSLAVAALLALGLSACSSMSERGPTAFIDSDPQYDDSGDFPTFGAMATETPRKPNLRERDEIAKSLVPDYQSARYTSEVLRGDMDMSALPPTDTVVVATYKPKHAIAEPQRIATVEDGQLRVPTPPSFEEETDSVAIGGPYLASESDAIDAVLAESDFEDGRVSVSFQESSDGSYAVDVSELRQEVYAQKLAQSSPARARIEVPVSFAKSSAPPLPSRVARLLEESASPENDEQVFWDQGMRQSAGHLLPVMKPERLMAARIEAIAIREKPQPVFQPESRDIARETSPPDPVSLQ